MHGDKSIGSSGYKKVLDAARDYLENYGFSIIPVPYGKKGPVISWKEYQKRKPTSDEIEQWFSKGKSNIAVVCGVVSGNLVVLDFDSEEKRKEFFERLQEEDRTLGARVLTQLESTLIVRTSRGYHYYIRIKTNPENFKRTFRSKSIPGIDFKAEGGLAILPPSLHPTGVQYKFERKPPIVAELEEDEAEYLRQVLGLLGLKFGDWETYNQTKQDTQKMGTTTKGEGSLSPKEIDEIVSILENYYVEGTRDYLVFYLSGWLKKGGVPLEDARQIIEKLAENDEEIKQRLYVLERTYKGEEQKRLKGYSGLQELFETILKNKRVPEEEAEQIALEDIRKIENILKSASPYRDSVFSLLDYEKQLYAVANLRKLVIVRARRDGHKMIYKEKITEGAPIKVEIIIDPLTGDRLFKVAWQTMEGQKRGLKPKIIGPATVLDIIDVLKRDGLVRSNRLVNDVLPAVLDAFVKKNLAEIKTQIEKPGFYLIDGKLTYIPLEESQKEPVSKEELKEALEFFDELATHWYGHVQPKFITAIKWGVASPFFYIRKQQGKTFAPWLFLYGSSQTGKTTIGRIILKIYGLPSSFEKGGGKIDTVPRLGEVLSTSTYPVLINEPRHALQRDDVREVIKSAVESTESRGKFIRGRYTAIPSLAPLILASNTPLPEDDALRRRFLLLSFTYGEKPPKEKIKEFNRKVLPKLSKLNAIGKKIAEIITTNPEILNKHEDWVSFAEELLELLYKEAGLKTPDWINQYYEEEEDISETLIENIRNFMTERFNNAIRTIKPTIEVNAEYSSTVDKESLSPSERVKIVLNNRLISWAILKDDKVIFTSQFAREAEQRLDTTLGGLKGVGDLLGWEYAITKLNGKTTRVLICPLEKLIEFLYPDVEGGGDSHEG